MHGSRGPGYTAFLFHTKAETAETLGHLERALEIDPGYEAARRARNELARRDRP